MTQEELNVCGEEKKGVYCSIESKNEGEVAFMLAIPAIGDDGNYHVKMVEYGTSIETGGVVDPGMLFENLCDLGGEYSGKQNFEDKNGLLKKGYINCITAGFYPGRLNSK